MFVNFCAPEKGGMVSAHEMKMSVIDLMLYVVLKICHSMPKNRGTLLLSLTMSCV